MRCNERRGVQEEEPPAAGGENGGLEANPLVPDGYFEFEAIRRKRMNKKGKAEYLVKWVGWPESANTWESYEHLEGCADDVEAFEKRTQQGRRSVQPTRTFHEEESNARINPSDHEEESNGEINPSHHEEETNGRINPSENGNHDDPAIVKIIRCWDYLI